MNEQEQFIYDAWRDSEAYAVPMTAEGERLALMRWYGFKKGWEEAIKYLQNKSNSCYTDIVSDGGMDPRK